ncbi:MAG: capsular polysaccharide synthesis protein [Celeribacter sp.]|jgi:hypothetical protein
MYWQQGEAAAPELVRLCIASWRTQNPGWEIVVLDGDSAAALVDMSDLPSDMLIRRRSNLLRMRLILAQGGVWADATTFCAQPLDDWLPLMMPAGMFVFSNPHPDRVVSTWFLAACPGHDAVRRLEAAYLAHLRADIRNPPYFAYHYVFEYLMFSAGFRRLLRHMPRIGSVPLHRAQRYLVGRGEGQDPERPELSGVPLHKLTWKKPINLSDLRELLIADRRQS